MTGKAMAGWQPALAARFGVHYGWVVVAVTLPTLLVAAGLRASPGVIIRPWEAEFGWDRAAISTIIAVSWIAYGIANPLAGRFLDTLGLAGSLSPASGWPRRAPSRPASSGTPGRFDRACASA